MERRNYATILLFFFAMAEGYAHPQTSNEQHRFPSLGSVQEFHDDKQVDQPSYRKFYEDREQENSDLQTLLFNRDYERRVKRDRKPTRAESMQRIYKEEELATLTRRAWAEDSLNQVYVDLLNRFKTIVERYLAQGMDLTRAINQFEENYANLATEIRAHRNRRN